MVHWRGLSVPPIPFIPFTDFLCLLVVKEEQMEVEPEVICSSTTQDTFCPNTSMRVLPVSSLEFSQGRIISSKTESLKVA